MTNKVAAHRASRLREFHDCDQEYKETRSGDAAKRRAQAMRKNRQTDFNRASEEIFAQRESEMKRKDNLIRKYKVETKDPVPIEEWKARRKE